MVPLFSGESRFIGFRFVITENYPFDPPHAYLDEPENATLIEIIDYLDAGNRIMFKYL
jgi:hypothetical protein